MPDDVMDQQDDNTQTPAADESHPDYTSSAESIASGAEQSSAAQSSLASFMRPDPYHKFLYDYKHKFVPQVDSATGQPVLDETGQPKMTQSDWYVSPARRALQSFLTAARTGGVSLLAGDFDPMRALKFEQFKTDQQMQNENLGRAIQQKKEADLQQSRQARLNFQTQKETDAKNLSEKKYALSYGHTQTQERQADQRLILANQAEQDRKAGKDQSLSLQAEGPALKAATNYVTAQHAAAGDDLKDPNIQNHMRVEIAARLDEEQPKAHADAVWSRLGATGLLDKIDWDDPKQLQAAINNADMKPEDKAFMKGWVVTHPTPASTSEAGEKRMKALGETRVQPTINTNTGQLGFTNANQINAGAPVAPAGAAGTAMSREAIFTELHRAVNQSKAAWGNIKNPVSTQARYLLSRIQSTGDPNIISTLLQSKILGDLPPEEQDLIMSTGALKENALSMRSVAGMGQGSESTRSAVDAILPSGRTPDPTYAMKQLGLLENQINTLQSGVPKLGNVTERQKTLETPSGQVQWRRSKKTGEVQSSNDGGKTWQTRSAPK